VLSEKVPVAVNCLFVPAAMLGLVGVTAMDTSVAEVTLRLLHPEMFPHVTLMTVLPTPLAIIVICPGALTAAAVIPRELIIATF
jgi:hypothetical protein